jgi:hypothetical protein
MSEKGWKKAERMFAADVGQRRVPVTGERHGADFVGQDGAFCYQLKIRRSLPTWLFDWLAGIVANAAGTGRTGVLVLNRPRTPRRDALVILRWSDWVAEHGAPSIPDDEPEAQ